MERRRRDNINDRIHELAGLVPDSLEDGRFHKGIVLQKAIEYIHYLQEANQQMQDQLRGVQANPSVSNDKMS